MSYDFEKAYQNEMSVTFLTDDELKFELEIRNMHFDRQSAITVQRRKLRNAIREEVEGLQRVFVYHRRAREELSICQRRLERAWVELQLEDVVKEMSKTGLLHLYNRLKLLKRTYATRDCVNEANWIFSNVVQTYVTNFVEDVRLPTLPDSPNLVDLEGAASLGARAALESDLINLAPPVGAEANLATPVSSMQSRSEQNVLGYVNLRSNSIGTVETDSRVYDRVEVVPVVTNAGAIPRSTRSDVPSTVVVSSSLPTMVTTSSTSVSYVSVTSLGQMPPIWSTPRYQVSCSVQQSRHVRFDSVRSLEEDPNNLISSAPEIRVSRPAVSDTPRVSEIYRSEPFVFSRWDEFRENLPTGSIRNIDRPEPRMSHPSEYSQARPQWSDPCEFSHIPHQPSQSNANFSQTNQYDIRHHGARNYDNFGGNSQFNPFISQRNYVPLPSQPAPYSISQPMRSAAYSVPHAPQQGFYSSDLPAVGLSGTSWRTPPPPVHTPAPSINPFEELDFNPTANRVKTIPVVKWPMRYAGEDRGMGLNDFLWEVSDWTKSEQISEYELLRSFGNLLTGRAKLWFTSNKHRFNTYSELIANLKLTFRHPDLDHFILLDIYQKRQQKTETFLEFFLDIEKKFKSLTAPVSEIEIVQAVRRNLRPEYKRALIGRELYDLYSLQMAGQEIDATNTYLFVKPQNSSQTNAVQVAEKRSEGNNNQSGKGPNPNHFQNKGPNNNPNYTPRQGYGPNQGSGGGKQWTRKEPGTGNPNAKVPNKIATDEKKTSANNVKGDSKTPMNMESKTQDFTPLNDQFVCFNCRSQEHLTHQCTKPYKVHCQVCGFSGFPTHRCPFCAKNSARRRETGPAKEH